MHFDWWTFALQTVNFTVLVWLLHRFLYRPVRRVMADRRAEIEQQYEQSKAEKAAIETERIAISGEREHIVEEREKALKSATVQAEKTAGALRSQAQHEAADLIATARKQIEREREAALVEARHLAVDLGCDLARRLLAEMPTRLRAEAWLDTTEQHLDALSAVERERLMGKDTGQRSIRVQSACEFPPESIAAWQERLRRRFGNGLDVQFAVRPELIAGVELQFPNAILRFSWQSTLAAVRSEVEDRADAR